MPLYPQRVTVWCGLWSGGVIGTYFFENEVGATVTVNGLRYREMINDLVRNWMVLIWTTFTFNKTALYVPHKQRSHWSFKFFFFGKFPDRVIS